MGLHAILLVLVCYHLLFQDRVQSNRILSQEEDFDIDKQLKLLNKPAVKTIVNKYGDIYDCVDFYKQLAFDHPLFKNQTFDFQVKKNPPYNTTGESNGACPIGSVPIRRITKDDLFREKQAYKDMHMDTTNRPGTYLAIVRTKRGHGSYAGAKGWISIHDPKASGRQFSATRIKLQSGPNSIEAGWRVDPTLYGDNKTRFFVRTDAGRSHCFNTRCPGFVHISREFPIDFAYARISIPLVSSIRMPYEIIRDNKNGNWNLRIGTDSFLMGFWHSHILPRLVNYVEWGAAAYAPPGSPLPKMGSGNFPIGSTLYDASISRLQMVDEQGRVFDAKTLETHEDDSSLYSVIDAGYVDDHFRHLMAYGGPGNRKIELNMHR